MEFGKQKQYMKNKKIIESKIKNLSRNINKQKDKTDSMLVDDIEMTNSYHELRIQVGMALSMIFGPQEKINNTGLINNLFNYQDIHSAVLFSHWTYKGLPHQYHKEKLDEKDFRMNPFYKGNRWSNEAKEYAFYKFFREIKRGCKNDVPIDFFSKYCIRKGIRYIYISTNSNTLDCSIKI
ncbi:MAG: hypothetical protein SCARUB_03861 [Candidatus Scalindua rubra]|uniref:Uncharacterized protein n=1 Tax=Candidatus Scalindua rubra TaxID=1872076 RepID=A0A1E3X645_9BACT|nr:MAG: hypothetical protein SCARUB_03861 [Candidatus Scalindua rubra]